MKKRTLLFNPVCVTHDRHIKLFERAMPGWRMKRVLNPSHPWFQAMSKNADGSYLFAGGRVPGGAFEDVGAVVCFSSQPRVPALDLITQAALRSIPVIAVEEVFQLLLEQGYVNEYFLPVDHLFVGSSYERNGFIGIGVPEEVVDVTGCPFRQLRGATSQSADGEKLRAELGCAKGKPVVTLSLAYLTPSGETLSLRKKLLAMAEEGVPSDYELVVKPHPGETDKDVMSFIKAYAPRAKIAHPYTPINRVLDITDILLNRGNSQVVINALDREIPVIVMPMGRPTLFDGVLDPFSACTSSDIRRVAGEIRDKGFGIYKPLYDRYLSIGPDDAMRAISSRVKNIADGNVMYSPEERLAEIALFWAWQGYAVEALKVLAKLESSGHNDRASIGRMWRLISGRADREDITLLTSWAGAGYRKWVVQSLWIKSIFYSRVAMNEQDREWLDDFPPRMNRHHFLPFVFMLGRCLTRANFRADAERLASAIRTEYGFEKGVVGWARSIISHRDMLQGVDYWCMRTGYGLKTTIKELTLAAKSSLGRRGKR